MARKRYASDSFRSHVLRQYDFSRAFVEGAQSRASYISGAGSSDKLRGKSHCISDGCQTGSS